VRIEHGFEATQQFEKDRLHEFASHR
jgi:hypothetical protein